MIDIDKIAAGFAADVARTSNIQSETIEKIVRDAFQRGHRLGLAMRRAPDPSSNAQAHPANQEHRPWTAMH